MSTPQSTPVRQAKLGISSTKSLPLASEYKRLLGDQHQRLSAKHQQDLDLLDDIRSYVKARLSIERDYTSSLGKLAKQHLNQINRRFTLLVQCDVTRSVDEAGENITANRGGLVDDEQRMRKQLASSRDHDDGDVGASERPLTLYKVWLEHINKLQSSTKNRADQFEQLLMIVDKLKDIRSHKATIGKKCLDNHLKRIHEDLMVSLVELERAKKLYYEDECQAKKARENEEKIKKKRSGLLTKFTDLQAKKEKTLAQREATDIQSTQARNDYIMALAAANAHLQQYYKRDLSDFISLIDDGVLDHCKIFMATLSECDINSLKDGLHNAQYWSRLINSSGSQQTNFIFLDCEQSACLRLRAELAFEPCNNDPISGISLEHNADYALQHEIDKWFTWFKKECRNLSQLMHQLDTCQHAFAEGKRSVDLNGQTVEDLEPKIIELKQQIRKCEAAKLKAQARLKVIKEGGMQIEEWSTVESEIRADMARAQEEQQRQRLKEKSLLQQQQQSSSDGGGQVAGQANYIGQDHSQPEQIQLQVSHDSDLDESSVNGLQADGAESMHNLASVSRSTSNLIQKQQNAITGYSALTDPSLVWQDDYSSAWAPSSQQQHSSTQFAMPTITNDNSAKSPTSPRQAAPDATDEAGQPRQYDLLNASTKQHQHPQQQQQMTANATSVSIQSSSPLSAIVNGQHNLSSSPYQGMMSEAYKSDYECDYNRTGLMIHSAASSAEPNNNNQQQQQQLAHLQQQQADPFRAQDDNSGFGQADEFGGEQQQSQHDVSHMLNKRVVALYNFEKNNDDDLEFAENDVLLITEVTQDDVNWLKARHLATGLEGYIPASYVRLLQADQQGAPDRFDDDEDGAGGDHWASEQRETDGPEFADSNCQQQKQYCRALYDYKPEENTFEEDGLPHLDLTQGELMQIIDQGEEDGWWLVEKNDHTRGHVPSMLVEEVDPDDDEDDDDELVDDDGSASLDDADAGDGPVGLPPSIEAPVLATQSSAEGDGSQRTVVIQTNGDGGADEVTVDKPDVGDETDAQETIEAESSQESQPAKTNTNSLIPTSFIIIEPTPEVESRRFEDNLDHDENAQTDQQDAHEQEADGDNSGAASCRRVVNSRPTAANVSYSVVNEDFVLERPTRKPHQFQQTNEDGQPQQQHHETPTILEETITNEELQATSEPKWNLDGAAYEPLSEVDSTEIQAPPSVVVDSFDEDDNFQNKSECEDDQLDGETELDYGGARDVVQVTKSEKLKNQGNEIDAEIRSLQTQTQNLNDDELGELVISQTLRNRADEFSRQIIEEAIMLAPGASIGPSTSSADSINSCDDELC